MGEAVFVACPHPSCDGRMKLPEGLPEGLPEDTYDCVCRGCVVRLARTATGEISLTLAPRSESPHLASLAMAEPKPARRRKPIIDLKDSL